MIAYKRQSRGFSLVELMISLAIGLIVVTAVLAFTLSSLTANSEYVQSTRLSQELRNSMDFISRELRRAGYDENMNRYTAASTQTSLLVSPFSRIYVEDDADGDGAKNDGCVIYAYDRTGGTPGAVELDQGEIRALRLAFREVDGQTVGVLEIGESDSEVSPDCDGDEPTYSNYPATCNKASGWCALTDPRVINITNFRLDTSGYIVQAGTATSTPMTIREIGIGLDGQLRQSADGTVTRGIRSRVKVRADCLEASANCALPPTET
jgi:prepilin-type N-terminal cleavage/methylation domain-containing protein